MKKESAAKMVLGSGEVQKMLFISKSRLKALVDEKKLPILKELKREYLFWLPDVEKLKQELLLDSRSNIYKHTKEGMK